MRTLRRLAMVVASLVASAGIVRGAEPAAADAKPAQQGSRESGEATTEQEEWIEGFNQWLNSLVLPNNRAASFPGAPRQIATPSVLPAGSPTLGLEGFCPVTLIKKREWQKGNSLYGAIHRGRTYLFVSLEGQATFLKDPDRYAPVLSGNDLVSFVDDKKQEAGRREHGVFYGSHIYLFANEENLAKFSANANRYVDVLSGHEHVASVTEPPELNESSIRLLVYKYQLAAYKSLAIAVVRRIAGSSGPGVE